MVSYPNRAGARFDEEYYMTKHMPMVGEKLSAYGLTGWSIDKGLAGGAPGSAPKHLFQAHLHFKDLAGFQAGMAAVGAPVMADVPNYTDIQPDVQVYQVLP